MPTTTVKANLKGNYKLNTGIRMVTSHFVLVGELVPIIFAIAVCQLLEGFDVALCKEAYPVEALVVRLPRSRGAG